MDARDVRKATPGIMVSWRVRVHIGPARCGGAVGSSSPGCAVAAKGGGVHALKGHVSWVQNGASQFGLYLSGVRNCLRGRKEKYERNLLPEPLVCRLSDRAMPGSHAPADKR